MENGINSEEVNLIGILDLIQVCIAHAGSAKRHREMLTSALDPLCSIATQYLHDSIQAQIGISKQNEHSIQARVELLKNLKFLSSWSQNVTEIVKVFKKLKYTKCYLATL